MPITWKNVSGSSGAGNAAVGAKLFEQSRDAMGDAFAGFEGILQNNRDAERAAWLQGKDNNTQAFLDQLSQYKSAEEFEAAKAAGQLPNASQFGAQIDRAAVRDAAEARLGTLQDAAIKTIDYGNKEREAADAPILAKYQSQMLALDPASMRDNESGVNILKLAEADGLSPQGRAQLAELFHTTSTDATKLHDDLLTSASSRAVNAQNVAASVNRVTLDNYDHKIKVRGDERTEDVYQDTQSGQRLVDELTQKLAYENQGVTTIPADSTERAREQLKQSLADNNATPDVINSTMAYFDQRLEANHALGKEGQALVSATNAAPIQRATIALDNLDKAYKDSAANNPLVYQPVKDPEATITQMVETVDVDKAWTGGERTRIHNAGIDLIANGIENGTDKEGNPVFQPVTTGMLNQALKEMETEWQLLDPGSEDKVLKEKIKTMIQTPGFLKRYESAQQLHAKYSQDRKAIESDLTSTVRRNEDAIRAQLLP